MDGESGGSREEDKVPAIGKGLSEMEILVQGCRRKTESCFHIKVKYIERNDQLFVTTITLVDERE